LLRFVRHPGVQSVAIVLVAIFMVIACDANNVQIERRAVDEQQNLLVKTQPVPYYEFSLERDVVIQLYNARNDARLTHSVITAFGDGQPIWDCPSIGFPIPADVQLTNPVKETNGTTIEQPEPNGLYSSKNTDATWVLCADGGEVTPIYVEQKVITFPFPVIVDYVTGTILRDGEATTTIDIKP